MKNIAIFGASRAGKSTLADRICEKFPHYHIIIGDAIRGAFSEVLPQNNINSKGGSGMIEDFPQFLAFVFHRSIKKSGESFNYILDTCDISPEKAKELFDREDTQIIFLGFPKQTEEDHLNLIKQYETKKDWTYGRTEEYMKEHAKRWTENSRYFEQKCKELGIWFVDTSWNREKVLDETMKKLEKALEE